ncbi:HK97-gp10 family putative phage morphogenesis protein [Leeuwenhoekiella sp. LLG6367-2.1]|uniref:HK97-gp10 family putative phage morphogenesis protein n=1 Tax=Leeuwenhoekiella sp. LLG6367-2.1 TaxID=3160833 RepID=UPI0038662A4A
MSNRVDINVEGFEELRAKLKQLPDKVKGREIEKIMRRVARPTLLAARQQAPTGKTKALKKRISITRIRYRDAAMAGVKVTPSRKKAFYAHFVEYGHNVNRKGFKRKHRKGANAGGAIGKTKANPFMDRARTSTVPGAIEKARKALAKYVQTAIDRLSK